MTVKLMIATFIVAALFAVSCQQITASELDFNRDIRPILSNKCVSCHGPDDEHRQADLRFDHEASVKQDRDGYAVVVPGDLAASEMIARITTDDVDLKMPPPEIHKDLTAKEIELLKRWIQQGADWSAHWAYEPPVRRPAPEVRQTEWPRSWIDQFILAQIEAADLQPSPAADRVTLLRRLSFDLTGLPPSPNQVDEFLADQSDDALETVVDRLLVSDHYGERMAMFWLDLVRYADTVGYHGDQDHNISPYRDWVIDAFNENMPYSQMTREQLAGDLLDDANIDTLIASGYNRLLQTTHEGGLQPKEYLAIYAADRVRNVSAVWMGATVGCAQCHTHKYDPYTITDFYSLAAFFADIDEAGHFTKGGNSLPTNRPPEMLVLTKRERERFSELNTQLQRLQQDLAEVIAGKAAYRPELDQEIAALQEELLQLKSMRRKTMVTSAIAPRPMRVLPRGNWQDDSGPLVAPAIPVFLGQLDVEAERATRLDLANWLVDAEHGAGYLTARVMVNRLWAILFGQGLADLTDFGGQGKPPTHPELLDRLAIEFVESGWDIKQMVKQIVLTQTYHQSSVPTPAMLNIDPENKLHARQNRFRLPAEMVRDNVLAVSGLLVDEYGGRSARPYQPDGYYRHLNFPKRTYTSDAGQQQWRRGVYVHWQRQFLHPMLKAFDAPNREECTAERASSNTPLAALTSLNDPTFVEASRALASRTLLEGGDTTSQRITFLCRETLSRQPDDVELAVLTETLAAHQQHFQTDPQAAHKLLEVGLSAVPDKIDEVELAAWSQVARVVLNLNESMTRN